VTDPVVYAGALHAPDCPALASSGGREVPLAELDEWDRPDAPGNRDYRNDCQWCSVER
jgi:hypothetical protein